MSERAPAEIVALINHPGETRVFSLSEANQTLELVRKVTERAVRDLGPLQEKMSALLDCDPRLPSLESAFEDVVRKWVARTQRLGLRVSGLWEVGFDTGDGYLCWRHPEIRLAYFRDYGEDFQFRRSLERVIEEYEPDWALE